MSEFNTGKPPAGEAGMLLYNPGGGDRFDFKYSRGDGTFCCGSNCAFAAAVHSRSVGSWEAPSQYWRWATLAELTAAGIPESEARGMVHRSQLADAPWLPPQQEGFGPWIEHKPGDPMPVGGEALVHCLQHNEREARAFSPQEFLAAAWVVCFASRTLEARVVAYCVRLEVDNASAEPTAAEVEATQKPQSPEDFVRDMKADELAMNAGMLERDEERMWSKPKRVTLSTPSTEPQPWHLRMAPWVNRLGGNWGAIE